MTRCDRCGWLEKERDELRRKADQLESQVRLYRAAVGVRMDDLKERARERIEARQRDSRAPDGTRFSLLEVD